jgi:hypothetical protein
MDEPKIDDGMKVLSSFPQIRLFCRSKAHALAQTRAGTPRQSEFGIPKAPFEYLRRRQSGGQQFIL